MSRHCLLISLSGIDGTGKSTAARWIQEFLLDEYGIAGRTVWCKYGIHPFSRLHLARLAGRLEVATLRPVEHIDYTEQGRSRAMYRIYGMAMLACHLAQIALVVRASLRRRQSVVCDRYIFDTMVDLQQDLCYPKSRVRSVLDAPWIPQPDFKFLLDLPEQAAFARKPDNRSIEYLRERRTLYVDIARDYGLTILDASQPVETVMLAVAEQIREESLWGGRACQ